MLEIAINRQETYKNFGFKDIHVIKSQIPSLIAEILKKTLKYPDLSSPHTQLVKRLKDDIQNTTFISLNYDVIIDSRLFSFSDKDINYGIHFKNYEFKDDSIKFGNKEYYKLKRPSMDNSVNLFKLHGSLN